MHHYFRSDEIVEVSALGPEETFSPFHGAIAVIHVALPPAYIGL